MCLEPATAAVTVARKAIPATRPVPVEIGVPARNGVEHMDRTQPVANEEKRRLEEDRLGQRPWKKWGPYLSERQWGTVREDYSAGGDAWNDFPHDHARSRAYRWGEDGRWRRRDILSGCRRRRAGEQGRSLPPPAPQASLSLFRPYN